MAIKIPGGFVEICSYGIESYQDRYTDRGKILKTAFNWGPSNSVKAKGKVIIESGTPVQEPDEGEAANKAEAPAESNKPAESSNNEPAKESYTYTLHEAFMNMHTVYEKGGGKKGKKNNRPSYKPKPTQTPAENPTPKPAEATDNSGKEDQDSENVRKFTPGEIFYVQVLLPDEGCTIWKLQIDQNADADKVKNALRAKNFKAALNIAGNGQVTDGLVPLSAKSYMNKNAKVNCPFIGHCRYAFDSGTEKSSEESNTMCIAVAPIDPTTGKPNEETVFKAVYNIVVGDITGGIFGTLVKLFGKDKEKEYGNDTSTDEKDISDSVSKYIKKLFPHNIGDQSMYENFLAIRNYVEKNIKEKNLEYNDTESESVIRYSKIGVFAGSEDKDKSFFCY